MADLDLVQRPSGKWDFNVLQGDVVRTTRPWPAIMRLLLQGAWLGDNGERSGDCLNDVTISTQGTKDRVTRIAQTRLAALIRDGQIAAVAAVDVSVTDGRTFVAIRVDIPGEQPRVIQVPLGR